MFGRRTDVVDEFGVNWSFGKPQTLKGRSWWGVVWLYNSAACLVLREQSREETDDWEENTENNRMRNWAEFWELSLVKNNLFEQRKLWMCSSGEQNRKQETGAVQLYGNTYFQTVLFISGNTVHIHTSSLILKHNTNFLLSGSLKSLTKNRYWCQAVCLWPHRPALQKVCSWISLVFLLANKWKNWYLN